MDLVLEHFKVSRVLKVVELFGVNREGDVELDDDKGIDNVIELVESQFEEVEFAVEKNYVEGCGCRME